MAFTMSMIGRRCHHFFGGMGHSQNIFAAECSPTRPRRRRQPSAPSAPTMTSRQRRGTGFLSSLSTHLEYPAISNDKEHDGFAVMLHVKAPVLVGADSGRAPVDLVAVVDAGVSMAGAKIQQVKRAMGFVVDSLAPRDRLSVVAFDSGGAQCVTPLTRMSVDGKAAAKLSVESLAAAGSGSGAANVRAGLDEASKVLDDGSWHYYDVAAVILLSDGGGHDHMPSGGDYSALVPPFLARTDSHRRTPVHTFLLGSGDHGDVAADPAVKREFARVEAAGGMALARDAAERGDYAEAARILDDRRDSVIRSSAAAALSGDEACEALVAELQELSLRVANEREYRRTGRALLLAGESSHAQQRGSSAFATPVMRRERQQAPLPPPTPDSGSRRVSRSRIEARLTTGVLRHRIPKS